VFNAGCTGVVDRFPLVRGENGRLKSGNGRAVNDRSSGIGDMLLIRDKERSSVRNLNGCGSVIRRLSDADDKSSSRQNANVGEKVPSSPYLSVSAPSQNEIEFL
jgi:hypothetical protein